MSIQTEQAALSSIINGGWFHGGHILTESDFTDGQHKAIFRRIKHLADTNSEIDLFTVADGLDFDIDHFVTIYAKANKIRAYAETLKDETLKRDLHKAAGAILAGQGAGREQLIQAQSLLASLEGNVGGEVVPIGDHVEEWWRELGRRAEGGNWLHTGFADVDQRLGGLRGGDLIILAGRPAMGKTALALNIAVQCRKPTAFFSLEMQAEGLLDRVAASLAQIPLSTIRSGLLTDAEWSRMTQASQKIKNLPIHLDQQAGLTVEEIHARARSLKAKEGLSLVVVDYLQLIASERGQGAYEKVTHISQMSKRMAKDLNVPVLMLAQLSRKCEERTDKRPMMSDLRDSGSIEQDADVVAFVYRDEVYNPESPHKEYAELITRKVRQGSTGTDWFKFDGAHQKFTTTTKPATAEVVPFGGPGY